MEVTEHIDLTYFSHSPSTKPNWKHCATSRRTENLNKRHVIWSISRVRLGWTPHPCFQNLLVGFSHRKKLFKYPCDKVSPDRHRYALARLLPVPVSTCQIENLQLCVGLIVYKLYGCHLASGNLADEGHDALRVALACTPWTPYEL